MGCLSLLAKERSGPFDGWPRNADVSASWHSTPLSQPTRTPSTWASNERKASTVFDGFSASYSSDACQLSVRPSGRQDAISSGKACDSTLTIRKPRSAAIAASVAPVDKGSTTTTQSGLPSFAVLLCFARGLKRASSSGGAGGASMLRRASSMACWTVFEERQALSTTFLSDAASSLSSFMAMDSAGVVTSQVARRGRVVVSPPIFFLFRAGDACFLAGWLR
mmetsp:Transcript_5972/g.14456  ORF Transcript_5972/g.14456 Transcript_5972/m.14456 type:complete len:222 (+) Transcript_5972:1038-1703(+)